MTTREQIAKIRLEHPDWTKSMIARAVVPPVSPQRVNQIENGIKPNYTTKSYREYHRHVYHLKIGKIFKRCRYCKRLVLPIDK